MCVCHWVCAGQSGRVIAALTRRPECGVELQTFLLLPSSCTHQPIKVELTGVLTGARVQQEKVVFRTFGQKSQCVKFAPSLVTSTTA